MKQYVKVVLRSRRTRQLSFKFCLLVLVLITYALTKIYSNPTEPSSPNKKIQEANLLSSSRRTISLFPTSFYSLLIAPENQNLNNIPQFDPRLLPSLYISMINREILAKKKLPEDFSLPFNWNMLTDALRKLQENSLYEEIIEGEVSCETLKEKVDYSGSEFGCKNGLSEYGLNITIPKNTDEKFKKVDTRKLLGNLHCLTSFNTPNNLIFLGSVNNAKSLIIPAKNFKDGEQNIANNEIDHKSLGKNILVKKFIENESKSKDIKSVLLDGILGCTELEKLTGLAAKYNIPDAFFLNQTDNVDPASPLYLDKSLFEWDLTKEIEHTPIEYPLRTYLSQILDPSFEEMKHFGEAALAENTDESKHLDWRFFNGYTHNNSDLHQATIHRLLRSWFKFCKSAGIYSWLNHGPLIGYYWNGYSLPFDRDLDVQVPIQSLSKLAKIANNSVIFDMNNDDYINDDFKIDSAAEIGFRSYYLDVNPFFGLRSKYRGRKNLIDARYIDVNTGLYIDITALASFNSHTNRDPFLQRKMLEKFNEKDKVRLTETLMFDEFYNGIVPNKDVIDSSRVQLRKNIEEKANKLFEKLKSSYQNEENLHELPSRFDDLVNCRNYHFYNLNELLPLIPTYFENTITFIPSNWFKLLIIEYDPNAIFWTEIDGYSFVPDMKMWIPKKLCDTENASGDNITANCLRENDDLRREKNRLEPYTRQHKEIFNLTFPFVNLKEEITNIQDTFAINNYNMKQARSLFEAFDGSLLRLEPWVAQNYY